MAYISYLNCYNKQETQPSCQSSFGMWGRGWCLRMEATLLFFFFFLCQEEIWGSLGEVAHKAKYPDKPSTGHFRVFSVAHCFLGGHKGKMWRARCPCAQRQALENPGMWSTQGYLFHRKDVYTRLLPRILGVAIVNNLVTFAVSLGRPHPSLPEGPTSLFSPFLDLPP